MYDYLLMAKQGPENALINYHGLEVIKALDLAEIQFA